MINEPALRDSLLSVISGLKSQYVAIAAILAELQALRNTVQGLDPTFADVMEQKRQEVAEANKPFVHSIIAGYEEIFRKVQDGYVC